MQCSYFNVIKNGDFTELISLMENDLAQTKELQQFESLIEGLLSNGFGVCDSFLEMQVVNGLKNDFLSLAPDVIQEAGIGKAFFHQTDKSIRGDKIFWLNEEALTLNEFCFFEKLDRFIAYLNQTCFTSINAKEFHYAKYPIGTYYKKHIDKFKIDAGREFSFILYLNEEWGPNDGGELGLYLENGMQKIIPLGGRVVFFKSDIVEHEVFTSLTKERMSLTGWLKSVNSSLVI